MVANSWWSSAYVKDLDLTLCNVEMHWNEILGSDANTFPFSNTCLVRKVTFHRGGLQLCTKYLYYHIDFCRTESSYMRYEVTYDLGTENFSGQHFQWDTFQAGYVIKKIFSKSVIWNSIMRNQLICLTCRDLFVCLSVCRGREKSEKPGEQNIRRSFWF